MILYRSVGLQEIELIYDHGMKAFPASLPQQPIFYPVLQLEYARQIAIDWNAKNGQYAGYVTQLKVDDQYLAQFEKHAVGETEHEEFWIPAEELDAFNQHILGHIKVVEAYFGDAFQGFIPEMFGFQGKNAVAQFTLLANSYIYKRIDFYLEIRRNHKAVFLNYPFWQKHEFKNQGLKEKILQAIKEVWFTSFPNFPLPMPVPVHEDTLHTKQADPDSLVDAVIEDAPPIRKTESHSLANPAPKDTGPLEQTDSQAAINAMQEDIRPAERPDPRLLVKLDREDDARVEQTQAYAHFSQGVELGLSGKYHEAIDELSKAVEEDPDDMIAHTSLGVALHRLGEDDRALSSFEDALRIDAIYAEAHYFRANILYSQGNVDEAIAGYRIAIGLKPELIEAHQKPVPQDRLTDYSGSPAEMYWIARPAYRILELNKSIKTDPTQASLFKERAAQYYRLRNYVQAIADYSSSLEIQPNEARVFHLRGVAYEQIGQFDRALEDYRRAIAINPQLSEEYTNRGVTFGKMRNFRQSIASFTESIRLAPRNPNGYFNRGMSYFQLGDVESAIDDFSNAIQLAPGDEAAYYWRGLSNEEAGRQREATADYRQFLALSDDASAREQVEQKLSQWMAGKTGSAGSHGATPDDIQITNQASSKKPDQDRDLHGLLITLGERALNSTWFGSGVECHGEKVEELYAFTDQNEPIEGRYLLHLTSGIRQTIEGDFQAFDPGATSHWIFIRAWGGSGFYIETNDPEIKEHLKAYSQAVEEVEGASPPYESLFVATDQASK